VARGAGPFRKDYKHHATGEDNGDSHLKALLIHHEVIVPITAGKLDFGTWQRIFYRGVRWQRDKRLIVKVMESKELVVGRGLGKSTPRFLAVGWRNPYHRAFLTIEQLHYHESHIPFLLMPRVPL